MIGVPADIRVLGSGTSSGVPMIGCDCAVCNSTDQRNIRTRSSILIQAPRGNVLVDTATDFRQQMLREKIRRVDAVLFTHTHADHINGIDDLRAFNSLQEGSIPIWGSPVTIDKISRVFDYIFDDTQGGYRPDLQRSVVEGRFVTCGVAFQPIPLEHGPGESVGFRSGNFAYLTDCSGIPDSSWPLLKGVEVLMIDGLRYRPHASHFTISQAADVGRRIGTARTILTHLTHDVDHAPHSIGLPAGVEFAYDGLIFPVTLQGEDRMRME